MPLSEIEALAVPAAKDAVLFLWAVNCLLPQALQVVDAWGFDYNRPCEVVYDRTSIGMKAGLTCKPA